MFAGAPDLMGKLNQVDLSKYLDGIVAAMAIVTTAVGLTKNLSEHSQSRSNLMSKRDKELDRAGKLAGFYVQLAQTELPHGHVQLLQGGIQTRLLECVSTLEWVNLKLAESEKDPNAQLDPWKRVFLWFKPVGWRGFFPHLLAYVCFVGFFWLIYRALAADDSRYLFGLVSVIVLAFTFIFRSWSLDERRRKFGFHRKLGRFTQLLLVQSPENFRMLLGQLLFFVSVTLSCLLLIVVIVFTSLRGDRADIFGTGLAAVFALFLFVFVSLYTSIFHGWATAEFKASTCAIKLSPLRFKVLKHALQNLNRHGWKLAKLLFACFFGLFYIAGATIAFGIMLSDPRQRDGTGAIIAAIALLIGLAPIYGSARVMKICYSIDQASQPGEPLKGAAAAGGSAAA